MMRTMLAAVVAILTGTASAQTVIVDGNVVPAPVTSQDVAAVRVIAVAASNLADRAHGTGVTAYALAEGRATTTSVQTLEGALAGRSNDWNSVTGKVTAAAATNIVAGATNALGSAAFMDAGTEWSYGDVPVIGSVTGGWDFVRVSQNLPAVIDTATTEDVASALGLGSLAYLSAIPLASVTNAGTSAALDAGNGSGEVLTWTFNEDPDVANALVQDSLGGTYLLGSAGFSSWLGLGSLATMGYAPTAAVATQAMGLAAGHTVTAATVGAVATNAFSGWIPLQLMSTWTTLGLQLTPGNQGYAVGFQPTSYRAIRYYWPYAPTATGFVMRTRWVVKMSEPLRTYYLGFYPAFTNSYAAGTFPVNPTNATQQGATGWGLLIVTNLFALSTVSADWSHFDIDNGPDPGQTTTNFLIGTPEIRLLYP